MNPIECMQLLNLVSFDKNIQHIQKSIIQAQTEQKLLAEKIAAHEYAQEQKQEAVYNVTKRVDAAELSLKVLDDGYRSCIDTRAKVFSDKQLQALDKEQEILANRRSVVEQELFACWQELENAINDARMTNEVAIPYIQSARSELERLQNSIAQFEQEYTQAITQRSLTECLVAVQWLEVYNSLRTRFLNPVVPIENQSCQGCFCYLTPQDMQKLIQETMMFCKECCRLVYVKPTLAQDIPTHD